MPVGTNGCPQALAARPAPFQPGHAGSSGDARQIPGSFVTEEPSAGQPAPVTAGSDMRRRLTGLARMAVPARSRPGRGRSRAAARQCRGSGSLAMAVKAQVTAAPVPYPRPGSPGVESRLAGDRALPPAGGASRPDPVAGIGWDTVRAPAEAPWSPSMGRPRRTRPDQAGKTGRSLAPSPAHSPPGMLTHAC